MKKQFPLIVFLLLISLSAISQTYQLPNIQSQTKIASTFSGFPDSVANSTAFGSAVARIGDVNGDDIEDIAIGVPNSDVRGTDRGCVWICFMDDDFTVLSCKRLASSMHGMVALADSDFFGSSVAGIGDVDNDGIPDIAVGAVGNDDGGSAAGAVWIIRLNSDGTAKSSSVEISDTQIVDLATTDNFGVSIAGLGDVDTDGVPDIAVGANLSNLSSSDAGAVFIVFLTSAGAYKGSNTDVPIYTSLGLASGDQFGYALAPYPDVDADGVNELLVTAPYQDETVISNVGSVFLLRLDDDGTVKSNEEYLSPIFGDKEYYLVPSGSQIFGRSISSFDINEDGIYDMVVGSVTNNSFYGILLNDAQEDVQWRRYGSDCAWDLTFSGLNMGISISGISDLDEDGNSELLVGASLDAGGGTARGAVYVLQMDSVKYESYKGNIIMYHKISDISGGFGGTLANSDAWGTDICSIGDLDGDGNEDIIVTATFDDDGAVGGNRGALWVLFLDSSGVVLSEQKISDTQGGFTGTLTNDCRFGTTVTNMGDLDGDDIPDIAVGTIQDDDGGAGSSANRGAVWVIFLNADGTSKSTSQKISHTQGGFPSVLADGDLFGIAANIGDLDNDGINDMAVGNRRDDDGSMSNSGSVWILFMNSNGTVKDTTKLGPVNGNLSAYVTLATNAEFGAAVEGIGDFNGDGNEDIAVTAIGQNTTGAVYLIYLNSSGTAIGARKINNAASNFPETLETAPLFGCNIANLGDIDGNGYTDLLIGSQNYIGIGSTQRGCAWIAYLGSNGDVLEAKIIDDFKSDFYGYIEDGDVLGNTVAVMQTDLNNDGAVDFFLGARNENDGGTGRGAIYSVSLIPRFYTSNYVELEHELDNEYYRSSQNKIRFVYDEEYDVTSTYLEYSVYNQSRTLVAGSSASGSTTVASSPTVQISHGENFIELNFTALSLSSGYYVMEVTGRKNDKYYLRFKI